MVGKFLHVRYRVNDLEKTVTFYRDVLGLELVRQSRSGRGSELAFFRIPGSDTEIEICRYPASGPVTVCPDLTHLALEVDDLDGFAARIRKHGVEFSDGPHGEKGKGRMAFVDGPEGYEFEIIER
jgi:lactoylglutathione lyase